MFNLEHAIDDWCRSVVHTGCAPNATLDELKDHLHCLVEERQAQGMDAQTAFIEAIKQMGDHQMISDEYAKNQTLLQKMLAYEYKLTRKVEKRFSKTQLAAFIILWSLFCAGLMMATSRWFPDIPVNTDLWIIVLWSIPYFVAAAAYDKGCDLQRLKNLFRQSGTK